jgi:hypothetical protein
MEMELQGTASNEAGILQGEPGTIISLKEKDNHLGQIRAENLTCQATHETDMSSCQGSKRTGTGSHLTLCSKSKNHKEPMIISVATH